MPSSYEVVMQQDWRFEKFELRFRAFRVGFLIVNIFVSLLTVGGLFVVRFTDTIRPRESNLTKYCKDPSYSITPVPISSYSVAYAAISVTFALCFVLPLTTTNVQKYDAKQLAQKMLWKTWILGMHLICLYIFIEFLKCATGIPRPYFFSTQNKTNLYCKNNWNEKRMSISIEAVEDTLRKSFPSYRSAIYTFCVSFMYIYLDHFDTGIGLHAIQQVVIMAAGSYLTYFQFYSWQQGENHLCDILVGGSIGIIQAMITVRAMFGSVFRSRIPTFIWTTKNSYNFYFHPIHE